MARRPNVKETKREHQATCHIIGVAIEHGRYARADDWKEFKSEPGGFSILLPGTPKEEAQEITTGWTCHSFIVSADNDVDCGVAYLDIPDAFAKLNTIDEKLDSCRTGLVKTFMGRVREETKIALHGNGSPGRDLLIDVPDGPTFRWRVFLVKERLYQVYTRVEKGKENDAEVIKFLDSFKLTEK